MANRIRTGLGDEEFSDRRLRKFAWILAGMFLVFGAVILPWRWNVGSQTVSIGVAAVLAIWGGVAPSTLKPLYIGWQKLGHILGWINSRIILAQLFFGIVIPTALILKILRKDPMKRKIGSSAGTYRTERGTVPGRENLERPY